MFKRKVQAAMYANETGIQLTGNGNVKMRFLLAVVGGYSLIEAEEARAMCWCRSRSIIAMRLGNRKLKMCNKRVIEDASGETLKRAMEESVEIIEVVTSDCRKE